MPLKSETLPNKALGGDELLELAVSAFRDMLSREYLLKKGVAYSRVAMSISATFHLGQPHEKLVVRSYTKADGGFMEGEVPLKEPGADDVLVSLEREVRVDNPNLARIHGNLPIKQQVQAPPRPMDWGPTLPGEAPPPFMLDPYPQVENREIRYDPTQFPKPPEPVDKDVSEQKAKELGVPFKKAMGLKERNG